MRESFTGSQLALAAVALLVPPTLLAGGQLAWSAFIGGANHFGPSASAPAPTASSPILTASPARHVVATRANTSMPPHRATSSSSVNRSSAPNCLSNS